MLSIYWIQEDVSGLKVDDLLLHTGHLGILLLFWFLCPSCIWCRFSELISQPSQNHYPWAIWAAHLEALLSSLVCLVGDNPTCSFTLPVHPQSCFSDLLTAYSSKNLINCMTLILLLVFPGGSVVKSLSAVQKTQVWSLSWEDPLEKEMATHSSILSWEIPWTDEPGGLQSMGSLKS